MVFVKTINDLYKLKSKHTFKFKCKQCGKIYLTVWSNNKKAITLYESEYFYRVKEKVEKF